MTLNCPYLNSAVDLTEERVALITSRHPEVASDGIDRIAETLLSPEEVLVHHDRPGTRLFIRWYNEAGKRGQFAVVVVVSDADSPRHWIVTAFMTRRRPRGETEWTLA